MTGTLIDRRLIKAIGPVPRDIGEAIRAEVQAAVSQVLRDVISPDVNTMSVLHIVAPWGHDLARGLHWHGVVGRGVASRELLIHLADEPLRSGALDEMARDLDVTWAIQHGRYVEQIAGPGAVDIPSADLREQFRWLDAAVLGARIDVALEMLRLMNFE